MKFKMNKKRNAGFTLVEILAATAIVVILLAVGMVSVVRYARLLQITELDNAAREIYMAAENRAVLLTSSGRMEAMRDEPDGTFKQLDAAGGEDKGQVGNRYIYHSKGNEDNETVLAELLPEGAVDPALGKGYFYIVYNISDNGAASVTDVFYAEDASELGNGTALNNDPNGFYMTWRGSSRSRRLEENRMLGYFGSTSVDSGSSTPLYEPIVEIINGEELKVRVKFTARSGGVTDSVQLEAWLTYQEKEIQLKTDAIGSGWNQAVITTESAGFDMTTYTYTWVLDTLKADGPRSKTVFDLAGMTLGENFTASACVKRGSVNSRTESDTNNTLFAYDQKWDSAGETAYVANLRHLQNLDETFSGVTGKTAAVQVADIEQGTSELPYYQDYEFEPVENSALKSYDGASEGTAHFIKGLKVTAASVGRKTAAGLFATVSSTETTPWGFQNVRLVNTYVNAGNGKNAGALVGSASNASLGNGKNAGALVGSASNASFENCWVYWESDGAKSPKELLKKSEDELAYQITGDTAGGLAGQLNGGTITNCLAATLVQGNLVGDGITGTVGGLVGQTVGTVTVNTSYADCYLHGATAGGLVGNASAGVTLNTVYTAGFIDNTGEGKTAAGLCNALASVTVSATDAYSAMYYDNAADTADIKPLAPGVDSEGASNCHYLSINTLNQDKTYQEMAEQVFFTEMGTKFEHKGIGQSNPYHLRKDLDSYPLPGVAGLPHYGDWNAEFLKTSLVYFEEYKGGTYGVSGGGLDTLREDLTIVRDGYAVVFDEDNLQERTISFTQEGWAAGADRIEETVIYKEEDLKKCSTAYEGKNYYLAPLPAKLITTEYADQDFYQFLHINLGNAGGDIVAAYNPHFAKTASTIPDGETEQKFKRDVLNSTLGQMEISVRTARHLNELSKHEEYYHTSRVGRLFAFRQELNLNYTTYTGYDGWDRNLKTQEPIGRQSGAFNGRYYGGCNEIRGVTFRIPEKGGHSYAGLFGVSTGLLQDIVYYMDPETQARIAIGSETEIYIGALAGGIESGQVTNCAVYGVNLCGVASKTTIYMGGLVGQNKGVITGCSAESYQLKTEDNAFSMAYTGGLVGQNYTGGSISRSYAVGYVTAQVDQHSEARVCGFAGFNRGDIRQSYAATYLESSGAAVTTYGFCGATEGTQQDTFYLNRGNFTYRDKDYNANYDTKTAKPVSYEDLITEEYMEKLGMGHAVVTVADVDRNAGTATGSFPYPTGVRKSDGKYVHYGWWPEPVKLGQMGVYYWEKLELGTKTSYNVSLLVADPDMDALMVTKRYILSKERSNGSKVTDYGYGWYEADDKDDKVEVKATEGLWYTTSDGKGEEWKTGIDSDRNVDTALNELMPQYKFHSYHTFVPNPDPSKTEIIQAGLYSAGLEKETDNKGNETRAATPNAEITLEQAGTEVTFQINPHFADALSVPELPKDWKASTEEVTTAPGESGNPYEVRAIGQLSAINWNSTSRNTKTVMEVNTGDNNPKNAKHFAYLSTSSTTGKYFWRQTHDLNGQGETQTPIAEYYDTTSGSSGTLSGWFGGTYEGDDYVIENVNIQGQVSSCTGLFGVVFQGELSNIVMYSSKGDGVISTKANGGTDGKGTKTQSCWYAMGALAGMAGKSTIKNCSAAGYTIDATVYTHYTQGGNDAWGGNNIGGLIGATDGSLSNCAAVAKINIHNATENDNMRIGGLVGVCQGTISNCYAGGSIEFGQNVDVQRNDRFIYVGGIVGGSYFKPLSTPVTDRPWVGVNPADEDAKKNTSNELKNCYSYVVLPSAGAAGYKNDGKTQIRCLYALGGVGELEFGGLENSGICTITNCYYLKSEVMKNNPDGFDMIRPAIKQSTNLDLSRNAVQVVALLEDGKTPLRKNEGNTGPFVEYRKTLDADDVGKDFVLSHEKNNNSGWTYHQSFKRNEDGKEYTYMYCGDLTVGTPIFRINNSHPGGHPAEDGLWCTFVGWATGVTNGLPDGLTPDPRTFENMNVPMAVTYAQLSERAMCGYLNRGTGNTKQFTPITNTDAGSGLDVPGKYSYSTNARPELRGLDYPFPTILTRDNGAVHVHYGDWPLYGIERDKGAEPIVLDLFINGGQGDQEQLKLSLGVPAGGVWSVKSDAGSIATATVTQEGKLTVNGVNEGVTTVTVSYKVGGDTYELPLTVRVTAILELRAVWDPVYLFPGAKATIPLKLVNKAGDEVELAEDGKLTDFPDFALDLDHSSVYDSELLTASELVEKDGKLYLNVRARSEFEEEQSKDSNVGVLLRYRYDNQETGDAAVQKDYYTVNSVRYTVVDLPKFDMEEKQQDGTLRFNIQPKKQGDYTVAIHDAEVVGTSGVEVKPIRPTVADSNGILVSKYTGVETVEITLTLWLYDKDGSRVDGEWSEVRVSLPIPEDPEAGAETPPEEPGG